MKHARKTRLFASAASVIGIAGGMTAPAHAHQPFLPPYPGTKVAVDDCGAHPKVARDSTPYSGSVIPDPAALQCTIYFVTTKAFTPFSTIVDGTSGPDADYVAPLCNVQIQGPRVKWTVGLTAAGIRFAWDEGDSAPSVPPKLISWQCDYPWKPNLDE